jgi:hypothetical protein
MNISNHGEHYETPSKNPKMRTCFSGMADCFFLFRVIACIGTRCMKQTVEKTRALNDEIPQVIRLVLASHHTRCRHLPHISVGSYHCIFRYRMCLNCTYYFYNYSPRDLTVSGGCESNTEVGSKDKQKRQVTALSDKSEKAM